MLSRGHTPKLGSHYYFHEAYSGEHLWRVIPISMRKWWIQSIHSISSQPYSQCTLSSPESIFEDRTDSLHNFELDLDSGDQARLQKALNDDGVMITNVLCPFGCTDFPQQSQYAGWDLILQRYLLKVVLPLYSETDYHNFHSMSPHFFRDVDDYDSVLFNKTDTNWKIKPSIIFTIDGPQVLTCRHHNNGDDHLRLYPPRPPHHNLSARQPDQLSHCVIVPRVARPTIAKAYNTTFSMSSQRGCFAGIDTMDVTTHSSWSHTSELLAQHESNSLAGRNDIVQLLSQKVEAGQVSHTLASNLISASKQRVPEGSLERCCQGATFVPFIDSIKIHLAQSADDNDDGLISCVNDENETIKCRRAWSQTINIIQMEDSDGFGYQFRPIPAYGSKKDRKEGMMTWALSSILTSVKELWHVVDSKPRPFLSRGWEFWLLSFLQSKVFPFQTVRIDNRSPFRKLTTLRAIMDKVNRFAPTESNDDDDQDDRFHIFKFSTQCMHNIFNRANYPSVSISDSVESALCLDEYHYDTKDIIIIAGHGGPEVFGNEDSSNSDKLVFSEGNSFELRSIVLLKQDIPSYPPNGSRFEAIRYIRHGGHYSSWWRQERSDKVVTQCNHNVVESLINDAQYNESDPPYFYQHVLVYIKTTTPDVDQWRLQMFKSLGGKIFVQCQCNQFPLIPTNIRPEKKEKCFKLGCRRKEYYVCTNLDCPVRLCKTHYNTYPTNTFTTIDPDECSLRQGQNVDGSDDAGEGGDNEGDGEHCDESDSDSNDEDWIPSLVPCDNDSDFDYSWIDDSDDDDDDSSELYGDGREGDQDELEFGEDDAVDSDYDNSYNGDEDDDEDENATHNDFVTYNDIDASQDQSEDNIDRDSGFFTTQAGDLPTIIEQDPFRDRVSGHVLYNQAAVCTTRYDKRINGTNSQKHFIQRLCATTPGQTCPLISLEQCMHPRIFYSSASSDSYAILGALPTWVYGKEQHPQGFAHLADISRTRLTTSGSLTMTDAHYHKFWFDVMSNKALSMGDSRQIIERGFQVDSSSNIGLSVRNKNNSGLTESVDSLEMVRGLAASQQYIKWDLFLTATNNQALTPGMVFLHQWKKSDKWTSQFPGFADMSIFEQNEIRQAMEEASGPILLRNWVEVRTLILRHIKDKLSFAGVTVALFSRDEYQKESGNLFHEHFVLAILQATLDRDSERFVQDLLRTSAFDVIRTDEIESLMQRGLLKSQDEAADQVERARQLLQHRCNQRCQKKVGTGSDETVCRKLHSVRDSPDCSTHQFIPMKFPFSKSCIDVLEKSDLCTFNDGEIKFLHAYFSPTRHMAPCNMNAECNMSPVICEMFLLFQSMVNAQAIGHANAIAKYILKYIGKIDLCNRVTAAANAHSGAVKVGSEFLHNTKIASSAINEDKAFQMRRDKHHPTGRDMPLMEMYQLLLNLPEVTTNLTFYQISTLCLEVRARHKIKLKSNGDVDRPDYNHGDGSLDDDVADAHISGLAACHARENEQLNLHWMQKVTMNQEITARDHKKMSRSFDSISMFGLRPPELVSVFETPRDYYRLCIIDNTDWSDAESMQTRLSRDLKTCLWIDILGRQVRIRLNALDEVKILIEENLHELRTSERLCNALSQRQFCISINKTIQSMIRIKQSNDESLNEQDIQWKSTFDGFIHDDGLDLLPIPVMTNVNPSNTHLFFVHVILSLGKYVTEMDVLKNASPRVCLQKARLIGMEENDESRQQYANDLLRKYILEQVVFYPNSLRKADGFIVNASRIFETIILKDEFIANEIPFTLTEMLNAAEVEQIQFWDQLIDTQLTSAYTSLTGATNLPPRATVERATRYDPLSWDPVGNMERSENQNPASLEEQKLAIQMAVYSVNKYAAAVTGRHTLTYTKNVVIHGAPGTGKTYVGAWAVLYTMSQGLRCLSTALMAARANAIGGIHIHKLFCLNSTTQTSHPYRCAEMAMQIIYRKKLIYHALLTMDILFIDEAGQVSAELLSIMDIILRKLRKSQMPFGGVLLLGTMDHAQLQPINASPFLCSTLILTTFTMVELKVSVRAANDALFCEFQQLTRMNPLLLRNDSEKKSRFYHLARTIFTYVRDWQDPRITPQMARMFSRRAVVKNSTALYTEQIIRRFQDSQEEEYFVRRSRDTHVRSAGLSEWTPANPATIRSLNNALKEPEKLVLFPWGVYECTQNDANGQYLQSNLAVLVDMPSDATLGNFGTFPIFIAPPNTQHISFLQDDEERPDKEALRNMGWREENIGCAPERGIKASRGFDGKRKQYALKHIGALTINKSQGCTIVAGLAVEISSQNTCPWEKEQVVVTFSRTPTSGLTIIVGEMNFAVDKLWELVTTSNQWTQMMESVLNMVTINSNGPTEMPQHTLPFTDLYPFTLRGSSVLPTDSTGYVYLLISFRNRHFTYIGQTENIVQRFRQHQSGRGAVGTERVEDQPFAIACYITGLVHYTKAQRMGLEQQWRHYRNQLDNDDVFNIITQGERLVNDQNNNAVINGTPDRINFVRLISSQN